MSGSDDWVRPDVPMASEEEAIVPAVDVSGGSLYGGDTPNTQTNMVVNQLVEDRQQYHQERDEIARAVRDVQQQQQNAASASSTQQQVATSEIEAKVRSEMDQKFVYAEQQMGGFLGALRGETKNVAEQLSKMKADTAASQSETARHTQQELQHFRTEQKRALQDAEERRQEEAALLRVKTQELEAGSRRNSEQLEANGKQMAELMKILQEDRREREERERLRDARDRALEQARKDQMEQLRGQLIKQRVNTPSPGAVGRMTGTTQSGLVQGVPVLTNNSSAASAPSLICQPVTNAGTTGHRVPTPPPALTTSGARPYSLRATICEMPSCNKPSIGFRCKGCDREFCNECLGAHTCGFTLPPRSGAMIQGNWNLSGQSKPTPGMQTPSFGGSPGSGSPNMPGLLPGQVQPRWGPGAMDPLLPNDAQGGNGGPGGPNDPSGNGLLSYGQFMGFREQNENSGVQMSEYGLLGAIPKINIKLQSVLDKKGEKYDSRDLARFQFNKDALSEVQAKDMRNTKAYANQLRLAIGSMMSQGSVLESVHEQFLVGRFFKYCHDDTAAKLMKQRRIIRDDVEDSWSFDNYMRLVCVENPAKTITFMDCVREWSLKNWKKRGSVTLLTELIRIEDTANDCGFSLCGQNCSLLQRLMIWEEIICRISLPKDLERDIKRLTRRPVVTFEELKHMAVNDQDIVTMEEVRNSDRTVTTIKELEMPTINELQTWFPDATDAEINALYPKFGAKRDGKKPFFGGSGGSSSSSSNGSVPYFPGKCAKCGQIGHMARHCKQGDACNICGATDHRSFNCPSGNIGDKEKPEVALARFARKQKGKGKARQERRGGTPPPGARRPSVSVYSIAVDNSTGDVFDMCRVVEDVDSEPISVFMSRCDFDPQLEHQMQPDKPDEHAGSSEDKSTDNSALPFGEDPRRPVVFKHPDFKAEWRKRRSELDTGFNRENFDSVMMARAIVDFWLSYEIQLPESRVKQAAHTAGGEVFIDGTALVIYRNEQLKISGVAELIAIDDTEWKGKGASSLLGMRLKNRIGCHTWASETSPRAWLSSGPTIPLEDDKYHIELFAGVTGEFAQRVHEIAKANRGWSLEQVVFAADPAWHSNRVPLKMDEQKLFLKDVSANKITTTVEAQVEKAKFEFKFSNSNQEPPALVHGYRRAHYGVTNMPGNRGGRFPDSRASTRVVRDLDQPFGDFLEIDYSFQIKSVFLISRPLDRVRSIVVDYFFEQEEAGSKPVLPPYLFDLPITEEFFQPPLSERFYTMLRPPLTFSGVRVISLQRGDSVPEALSQKHKLHYVPREFYEKKPKPATEIVELLPSPLQEFEGGWCGIAKCVVDRVRAVPAYENFRREIEKTISEKGTIAIVVGDGVLDNVAIVESLKDKVHKNRIRHCSLTWGVDLLLKRITCTGELVPFGVTERTEAELKFDEMNRCCRKDPRFGLSRKQLFAFGVAKAIARRTGERGMTKVELMLEAAKQLRRFRYEDVEKACDAVMLTSTRHFRYSANPLRMVRGTWLGVDVRAVSKLDTTFLMEPWSDVGLAVVNVINCFDKQACGEMVGPKRIVCKREKTEQETLEAVNAVAPGMDLTSGHPNGQDVTRVASMAVLLRIIIRLLIVDPGPENIIRALALLMLGAGMRLRIASGNSARYMAMIERLQLTLKTQLESYRHDPYLSKLTLAVQVILCHMVRNERIRQNLQRTQEPASQRLELMASLPITTPESDSLVFWDEQNKQLTNASGDVIAADAQAVERARIRMGMQLVDKEFQAKIAKLKDQIEKDISAKEPLYEGDLVRYKTKGDDQEPATVVNPVPNREGKVLVKPIGAASKALGVARRFCQRVVDTDLSYVVPPDTVEITEMDLPYLPTLLQQIERGDMIARVTGPFVMKTCSDCGAAISARRYAEIFRMISLKRTPDGCHHESQFKATHQVNGCCQWAMAARKEDRSDDSAWGSKMSRKCASMTRPHQQQSPRQKTRTQAEKVRAAFAS
eukprot:g16611.t1